MRVASATVSGFRLLDGVTVTFEESTTIIVGRNNSGKTSFVEVFYKFLGSDKGSFSLDDFTLRRLQGLAEAGALWKQADQARVDGDPEKAAKLEADAIDKLPSITLEVEFAYADEDSLAPISKLILDLDPLRHDALLVCTLGLIRPREFLRAFAESGIDDISAFVRKRMSFFDRSFLAVDKDDRSNARELKLSEVKDALLCDFIYAQNLFDDTSRDTGHGLSKGFESYYRAIANTDGTVESLETALVDVATKLDGEYSTLFASVFGDLKHFGAGRMPSLQELKIVSEFRAADLLKGSTKVMYAHDGGADLPEAHNGLGFSKLIFIVLQFVAFFENYQKRQPRSGMELVFLEEPEAHLHPQMQSVFIKNINEYLKSKPDWNVQLVVTTHSSHVVAESGFKALRYFDAGKNVLEIKDLKMFRNELESSDKDSLRFLEQYLELRRCDMFFADKVILVEGAVERLLLPEMIRRAASDLRYQYVSVIEVGGAYAVKFRRLLEFLGVQTLIITDIDSAEASGHHKKTATSTPGAITTNVTLKDWLPQAATISELLAKLDADKVDTRVRVAYQVAETAGGAVGRSFEEAFILANAAELVAATELASAGVFQDGSGATLGVPTVLADSYRIAAEIESKSDFAFDILSLPNWGIPRYIKEGLEWLAPPSK
ncbi:AAA family ATPase [Microbacterium sp. STN6]|uniref:ATP-dependent nuclease n=1 Tax=Microbacterium sp. STN6 TaxID=2995588 RepID=UPI002260DE0E|nr:AAA family ATPase [Microbacterium sp. STN6]MCX7522055.1 AAA family ATPase [Microbacterium sp. STN6]